MSAQKFLVHFRDFPRNHGGPVSQNFERVFERIEQRDAALRKARAFGVPRPSARSALRRSDWRDGRNPMKVNSSEGIPDAARAATNAEAPGTGTTLIPCRRAETHEPMPGIGDCRRSRVGHQRDFRALLQFDDQFRSLRNFIVLVIADQPLLNLEMRKQFQRLPRVFARDHVHFLQNAQRAQGDVFQIADRRRDYVQASGWRIGSAGTGISCVFEFRFMFGR